MEVKPELTEFQVRMREGGDSKTKSLLGSSFLDKLGFAGAFLRQDTVGS